ncbi:hypothetical protein PtB15_1B944 [Puccinia triticina]|nr:hypothetical protein PtB15_1B944 [Puccinia triticina]
MPAPTTLVLLLLLALASQPIHAQAILNPASPASPAPAAPAASPSPAPTSPSPPPAEANPPAPPEPSQSSTTNAAPAAPTSSPVPANNSPASSSVQSANSQTNSPASSIVIVTLTRTGADGQIYTSLTSTYSPLARPSSTPNNNGSASGSSSNTWAIIGGIVGGLAGIAAVVFIVFRCTQRRFSDLDDEDVAIKWPELVNRAEDPSTLNPLAARPGVGHGIGEDDDQTDEKPRLYSHDIAMESLHSDQRHPGMYDSYQAYPPPPPLHPQEHNGYYDPYLGPSAAQQPYPGTLNNLGYDDQPGYQHRPHDLHSQPSLGSSVGNTHDPQGPPRPDSRQQQQQQQQQLGHLNLSDHHLQYPIAWDGPEDIPLTVVNNNSHHQQQQQQQPSANSAPLHNPYHPS